MNKLTLKNSRHIDLYMDDVVYRNDNLITTIFIIFPDKIDEYPRKDCNVELRAILPNGDYLPYNIPTAEGKTSFLITNDLTEAAQVVKLMMIITHNGNVIGSTNEQAINVKEPTKTLEPLTPRAEFDEVIAEQRAEIAEQAETISEQETEIEAKDGQISELNDEVSALEGTVAEQQATITRQNTTIDELNTRRIPVYIEPNLESKEITPSPQTQYYSPSEGKDGFSAVTVEGATVEALGLNENYYKLNEPFLNKVGKYHPFPENSYGGIYFTELNEDDFPVGIKVVNYDYNYNNFSVPGLNMNPFRNNIKSFILLDCKNVNIADSYFSGAQLLTTCRFDGVLRIGNYAFNNCTSLTELTLADSLTSIGGMAFYNCASLMELTLPDSLTSIGVNAFYNCTSLTELTLAQGFNCNGLNVSSSTRFTAETIVVCLEALADRTGQTAYTITFGSTNLNKLTAEQKAIATNKNWNLA